MTEITLEGR